MHSENTPSSAATGAGEVQESLLTVTPPGEGVPSRVAARTAARLGAAQEEIEELRRRLDDAQRALAERDDAIDQLERRHRLERLLIDAEAVDIEAATLLAQIAMNDAIDPDGNPPSEADIVDQMKVNRPFLFGPREASNHPPLPNGATLAQEHAEISALERAAEEAASTGDRNALLRYLRIRRGR